MPWSREPSKVDRALASALALRLSWPFERLQRSETLASRLFIEVLLLAAAGCRACPSARSRPVVVPNLPPVPPVLALTELSTGGTGGRFTMPRTRVSTLPGVPGVERVFAGPQIFPTPKGSRSEGAGTLEEKLWTLIPLKGGEYPPFGGYALPSYPVSSSYGS
jgi:hypothetical protein